MAEDGRQMELREALEGMVYQFGYWGVRDEGGSEVGGFFTGGLSALEEAFRLLGYGDFMPAPEVECCMPDCHGQATCGAPHPDGYRRTCGKHFSL
jgi:hypothetical protein